MASPIRLLPSVLVLLGVLGMAPAYATCGYSFSSLSNGTTADATTVMGNFNYILQCPNFTGPVGIGVASPSAIFQIIDTNGGIFFDGSGLYYNRFKSTTTSTSVGRGLLFTAQNSGTTADLYITPWGAIGLGTDIPAAKFHIIDSAGGMFFDGAGPYYNRIKSTTTSVGVGRSLMFTTQNSGNTADLYINSAGNIGIGTDSPAQKLVVIGTIRQSNCTTAGTLSVNTSGDIICTSDARLKNVLGEYTGGLNVITQIKPQRFTYKPTASNPVETFVHAGFIAQDVQRAIPQAVAVQHNGYLSLDTTAILAASVNSIKELKAANDRQAGEIAQLRANNATLVEQHEQQKADVQEIRDKFKQLEHWVNIRAADNKITSRD